MKLNEVINSKLVAYLLIIHVKLFSIYPAIIKIRTKFVQSCRVFRRNKLDKWYVILHVKNVYILFFKFDQRNKWRNSRITNVTSII